MPPKPRVTSSTILLQTAVELKSAVTGRNRRPAAWTRLAVSPLALRPTAAMSAPAAANAAAIAWPIPELAPVTTAIRPASEKRVDTGHRKFAVATASMSR